MTDITTTADTDQQPNPETDSKPRDTAAQINPAPAHNLKPVFQALLTRSAGFRGWSA